MWKKYCWPLPFKVSTGKETLIFTFNGFNLPIKQRIFFYWYYLLKVDNQSLIWFFIIWCKIQIFFFLWLFNCFCHPEKNRVELNLNFFRVATLEKAEFHNVNRVLAQKKIWVIAIFSSSCPRKTHVAPSKSHLRGDWMHYVPEIPNLNEWYIL